MARCPHTMKAKDRNGETYCCDCGTVTKREEVMTEEQIKHMRDRFLGWHLPKNFTPDNGISYTPTQHDAATGGTPYGTNLFDAQQAEEMVRHMIWDMPEPPDEACSDARLRELWRECGGEWHGNEQRPCQAMPDDLPDILRRIIVAATRAAAGLPKRNA